MRGLASALHPRAVHPLVTLPRPAPPPSASLPVDLSAQPTTALHAAATYLALSINHHRTHARTHPSITVLSLHYSTPAACPRAAESAHHVRYQVTNSQARLPKTTSIPAVRRPTTTLIPTYHPRLLLHHHRTHLRPAHRAHTSLDTPHSTSKPIHADRRPPDFRPSRHNPTP